MNEATEIPALFGPDQALFGMFTPARGAAVPGVGCLVLNTGVNHRIGPHRINVKAARRLAAAGIPTLRFDLSGIGDSMAARSAQDFRAQAVADMKAALDHLEQAHGLRRVLVFGICSGAENGLALALADPRVVGLLTFDGAMFLTRAARIERKLRRMAAFPVNAAVRASYPWWTDLMLWRGSPSDPAARARSLARWRALWSPRPAPQDGIFAADAPESTAADHEAKLQTLLARGVALSMMFSATYNATDRHRNMLGVLGHSSVFDRAEYRFWPDVDHTATTLAMQERLLGAVEEWAGRVAQQVAVPAPRRAEAIAPPAREKQLHPA